MKIIVDTNIVFSGILNSSSKIGRILTTSNLHLELYSCDFMKFELKKHRNKLVQLSKSTEDKIEEIQHLTTTHITFINESLIPVEHFINAEILLKDVDINDTPFVALAAFLDAKLWTGDKKLYNGLKKQHFDAVIDTSELLVLLETLDKP